MSVRANQPRLDNRLYRTASVVAQPEYLTSPGKVNQPMDFNNELLSLSELLTA